MEANSSLRETRGPDLDGSVNVLLAPVSGPDTRSALPRSLFVKHPGRFTAKFAIALALVVASWVAVALMPTWPVILLAIIILGPIYAHLVELQHECLHEHAYNKRSLNRLIGFFCGIPMMSSFSHYKYEHLRHHAYLGTPQNHEFFNYRFHDLDSPIGFLTGCFHLGRYLDVFKAIGASLIGRLNPKVAKTIAAKKIRTEYIAFGVILAGAIAFTAVTGNLFLLFVWIIPAVLIAEPAHFLIELPEHFGLNTQTDPNVLANTRSLHAGWFAGWFTNGNQLHTAHHFHQGVPMVQVPNLHVIIESQIETFESSYWNFYKKVITGELRYQDFAETCMTR
jgi:fatty acid desaturase